MISGFLYLLFGSHNPNTVSIQNGIWLARISLKISNQLRQHPCIVDGITYEERKGQGGTLTDDSENVAYSIPPAMK